jgi:hypothetical protein
VQRWLDDLQAAGQVAHEPERDQAGRWWRTQIVLLAAPPPDAHELGVARERARTWGRRERVRRRRWRRGRSLAAIRRRSVAPGSRSRIRLGRARAEGAREARRRAVVERAIAAGHVVRERGGLLTHPFGAPPTSAGVPLSPSRSWREQTSRVGVRAAPRSAPTSKVDPAFAAGTGAHALAASARAPAAAPAAPKECSEEIGRVPSGEFDVAVLRRVAERERGFSESVALRREHVARRSQELIDWPRGRTCPLGRLKEAWLTHRHGAETAAAYGTRTAGPGSRALSRRAARAIALYEQFAHERPPGWPEAGPAALCALAGQQRAAALAGDVARLLVLAKGMRAAALLADARRAERAAARASRRHDAPAGGVLWFRVRAARWESAEQRRLRVRDELLLAGADPAAWPNAVLATGALERHARVGPRPELIGPDAHAELDGMGARAARYRAELANGRWALPDGPSPTTTHHPREDSL